MHDGIPIVRPVPEVYSGTGSDRSAIRRRRQHVKPSIVVPQEESPDPPYTGPSSLSSAITASQNDGPNQAPCISTTVAELLISLYSVR